jgi:hypothetical protein
MEPFYFKKYDEIIGIASDINDLKNEIQRLKIENKLSVEYHLREGHIVQWLNYIGEKKAASDLSGVIDIDEALKVLEDTKKPSGKLKGMKGGPKGRPKEMGIKSKFQ